MLTVAERSARLETEIRRYVREGFWVQARTDTSARLVRPKQMHPAVVWASFLLIGIGVFIFIAYYLYFLGKRDQVIEISIDAEGNVSRYDVTEVLPGTLSWSQDQERWLMPRRVA